MANTPSRGLAAVVLIATVLLTAALIGAGLVLTATATTAEAVETKSRVPSSKDEPQVTLSYGSNSLETLEVFASNTQGSPLVLLVHGGDLSRRPAKRAS